MNTNPFRQTKSPLTQPSQPNESGIPTHREQADNSSQRLYIDTRGRAVVSMRYYSGGQAFS